MDKNQKPREETRIPTTRRSTALRSPEMEACDLCFEYIAYGEEVRRGLNGEVICRWCELNQPYRIGFGDFLCSSCLKARRKEDGYFRAGRESLICSICDPQAARHARFAKRGGIREGIAAIVSLFSGFFALIITIIGFIIFMAIFLGVIDFLGRYF